MPAGRGGFAALLEPDLRRVYLETWKERPREYSLVLNVETMPWNPVTDLQMAALGTMPEKTEGDQFTLDEPLVGGTKQYEATPYGLGFEVTYEMWRDDQYGIMREMSAELKRAGRYREEVNAWSPFNSAFDTAVVGFTAGESLCSTAHARIDGGPTQNNRPSPDIGFSVTALQNAVLDFEDLVNERGLPMHMAPTMVILAPYNKWRGREILGSAAKPYSSNNEINALIEEELQALICHHLTTQTHWFLTAAKGVHDVWFQWRDAPIFDSFDDPRTKNAVFTAYQRHAHGFAAWQGVYGSTG